MTWRELITDILINTNSLNDEAYISEYTRIKGEVIQKRYLPINRFSFTEAQGTGALIIEIKGD